MQRFGLGRIPAVDKRDRGYLMKAVVPVTVRKWRYWWANGWWGDQDGFPHCVSYAWTHWLEDGPVTHPPFKPLAQSAVDPVELYHEAQKVDEWEGESYDGTSVRAGAKVLRRMGFVGSYVWAWDVDAVVRALLEIGPVTVGTWWYSGMFSPDEDGFIKVEGNKAGGHAYVVNGVNVKRGVVRIKNSWGRSWGRRGHAWMKIEDLDALIRDEGEACLATELTPDKIASIMKQKGYTVD